MEKLQKRASLISIPKNIPKTTTQSSLVLLIAKNLLRQSALDTLSSVSIVILALQRFISEDHKLVAQTSLIFCYDSRIVHLSKQSLTAF